MNSDLQLKRACQQKRFQNWKVEEKEKKSIFGSLLDIGEWYIYAIGPYNAIERYEIKKNKCWEQ